MTTTRTARRIWPGMIFGLLGLHVCIVAVTVTAAHLRPASFAVEPDYDRKAMQWEDAARQLRHNTALGWDIAVISTEGESLGVQLRDGSGAPIDGAVLEVEAFHHAQAGARLKATCAAAGPGAYTAPLALTRPGLWELRFTATRGSDRFTQIVTRMIVGDGAERVP